MPIFLFNYSTRQLHGTFRAVTDGELEIKPHGGQLVKALALEMSAA